MSDLPLVSDYAYQLAVEHAPIQIVLTDNEGKILYANPSVEEITGYTPEEIIGNNPRIWGGEMDESYYKNLWKVIKEDKQTFSEVIVNRRKNGELYTAQLRISPILALDKSVTGFVGIEEDVTKRQKLEQQKQEFFSMITHDLLTPLGSMRWNLERLLAGKIGDINDKVKERINQVYESNRYMITLVNNLFCTYRIEHGEITDIQEAIDLYSVITQVVEEMKPLAQKHGVIVNHSKNITDPALTSIDAKRFRIVIENLLSNAIKYSNTNGTVSVFFEQTHEHILIKITDTGIGIPQGERSQVFTKFYRGENTAKLGVEGTGLGLFISHAYVRSWGGTIRFEGEEGHGSTFSVVLPRTPLSQADWATRSKTDIETAR